MASDVEIASAALRRIGDDPITSLTDDTERARAVNAIYGIVRDAVQRAHPWNFAVTRQKLNKLADAPAFGFDNAFQLPTSPYCLRALELYDGGEPNTDDDWQIEGRKLLTDAGTANLRYIGRVTDPVQFDGLFTEAFIARLAAELAYGVTSLSKVLQTQWALYKDKLREAQTADGLEGTPEQTESNDLTDVRL